MPPRPPVAPSPRPPPTAAVRRQRNGADAATCCAPAGTVTDPPGCRVRGARAAVHELEPPGHSPRIGCRDQRTSTRTVQGAPGVHAVEGAQVDPATAPAAGGAAGRRQAVGLRARPTRAIRTPRRPGAGGRRRRCRRAGRRPRAARPRRAPRPTAATPRSSASPPGRGRSRGARQDAPGPWRRSMAPGSECRAGDDGAEIPRSPVPVPRARRERRRGRSRRRRSPASVRPPAGPREAPARSLLELGQQRVSGGHGAGLRPPTPRAPPRLRRTSRRMPTTSLCAPWTTRGRAPPDRPCRSGPGRRRVRGCPAPIASPLHATRPAPMPRACAGVSPASAISRAELHPARRGAGRGPTDRRSPCPEGPGRTSSRQVCSMARSVLVTTPTPAQLPLDPAFTPTRPSSILGRAAPRRHPQSVRLAEVTGSL